MSCRQKNKKKGKKPGGIKVSDVAGKKIINHKAVTKYEGLKNVLAAPEMVSFFAAGS